MPNPPTKRHILKFHILSAAAVPIVEIRKKKAAIIIVFRRPSLSNLTVSSFCRYFKSRTQKTFSEFLNEVMVLNACKLLVKKEMTITQICYETGYNNISHFNRQFKLITGLTAKEYAKKYRQNLL